MDKTNAKAAEKRAFSFRINNPYKPDEIVTQDVVISNKLQYDYKDCEWIAIDSEFLGLDLYRDALCAVQIASPDKSNKERQRIEIISVFGQEIDESLKTLLTSNITKLFHVFSADITMLNRNLGIEVQGPVFDTKVATKLVWTNARTSSKTEFIKTFIDPKYEPIHLANARWEIAPSKWSEKMIKYGSLDVLYLHAMMLKLKEIAKDRNRGQILDKAMSAVPAISSVISAGFDVDIFKF